jgi:hypothetical protein
MNKILVLIVAGWMAAGTLAAASKPIQVSLTPELSLYGPGERIEGLALSLWGENPQTALALGIVNGSTGDSAGFSLGLLLNYADHYKGVQWAPINYVSGDFLGWQSGFVNYTGGTMTGLQNGVVNYAGRLTGLQFGLVNYAASAETGLQIGLVNFMPQNRFLSGLPNELAPVMVFVNWRL